VWSRSVTWPNWRIEDVVPPPPDGYSTRPATPEDFDAVLSVAQSADLADWGAIDYTAEFLRSEWALPGLNLRADTWLVEHDGDAAAYAWLLARDEHRELDGWGVVHPGHRGRGLGPYLLDLVEARAREHAGATASGAALRWGVLGPDAAAHRLLECRGFEQVRQTWRMDIRLDPDLAAEPAAPAPPRGVAIRPFDRGRDAGAAHAMLEAAFASHFGWVSRSLEEWAAHRLESEDFDSALWFVAVDGTPGAGAEQPAEQGRVIGLVSGMVTGNEGFIATLGVHPSSQGRGVGTALLRTAFRAFARRGLLDVSLEVDSENETGAVAVYERVGMRPSRRFDTFQKTFPAHS
jgi:mycothiol synthase